MLSKRKKTFVLGNATVCALVALVGVACGNKEGDLPGAPSAAAPSGGASADDPVAAIQAKLQPYIGCHNRHSGRAMEVFSKYLERVDPEKGPTADNAPVMLNIFDISQCVADIAKANNMTPRSPKLEAAANEYAAALTKLAPIVKEAYDYYQAKNYKDDQGAKGTALHPQLMAAFEAFEKANKALSGQVTAMNRKMQEEDLARRAKAGQTDLLYHTDVFMLEAESLLMLCKASPDKIDTIDVPGLTAQIAKVEKQLADVESFAEKNKDQVSKLRGFTSTTGSGRQFLTAAKELMRRVRDKKPFSDSDKSQLASNSGYSVQGSPTQVSYYYNQMVEAYNRM